jgi:putative FmdB family regulatory protein
MPVYDFRCEKCGEKKNDEFVHKRDAVVTCACGAVMTRLFPDSSRYIGAKCFPAEGIYLEHAGPKGTRFYSEKEMRQYEKATGATIARLH